ncbi:MAG: arsenate reductase ArsC [Candidatus Brocadia sp.]|nr:arsenate reductase ArsC [Candidatus Brocadia sp.]
MDSRPIYLFVCVENACRSQMAEGIFNTLTDKAVARSAGTEIAKEINPVAIEVMKERGIDISQQKPKVLDKKMIVNATKFITMGCTKNYPLTPKEKTIDWNIPDPKAKNKQYFVTVRDLIERHIVELLKQDKL